MTSRTPLVKLCGLRSAQDARAAVEAGADLLGFVLAPSARRVAPDEVAAILAELRSDAASRPVPAVAVVASSSGEDAAAVRASTADLVQLARDATPAACRALAAATGIPVFAVHHVDGELDVEAVRALDEAADLVLLDTSSPQGGGSGHAFDHGLLDALGSATQGVGIAGGLTPETVGALVAVHRPRLVDVSSGIEHAGQKDPDRMRAFVAAAKGSPVPPTAAGAP